MNNKIDMSMEHPVNINSVKNSITEDDLHLKLKQIKEVTNCNEEEGILILHDCNYNVEYAINKMLNVNSPNYSEWKTKKGKPKKVQIKIKQIEIQDINNNVKDTISLMNSELFNNEKPNSISGASIKQYNQDSYNNGKTFRNFNLSKKVLPGYFIAENLHQQHKSSIFDLNFKWDGKSIIIENKSFSPMSCTDLSTIIDVKNKAVEKPIVTSNEVLTKEDTSDTSIMFKTHCSTKPPPKVQYTLAAPVQIMNKNITHRSMPKLKFGDTDFCENSNLGSSENRLKIIPQNNVLESQSPVINIEDNSILQVGPSQKIFVDKSSHNFTMHPIIYNQSSYFNQKNIPQSNVSNNIKNTEFQNVNSADQYYENYGFINIHNQLPVENSIPCNAGFQGLGTYAPSNLNNTEDVINHSKTPDIFVNQSQSNLFPPQSNMNHPKSTIYLVPNMMMNPMNALYMTVANPLPTSALSPPMAPIQAQYNVPPQHNPIFFEESQNQADDVASRIKRQYIPNRQQPPISRMKKSFGEFSEDLSVVRGNFKSLPNFPINQTSLSKQVPINYYINAAPTRPQLIPNSINNFGGHFQQQDLSNFDNRKRNMPIPSNNFSGKPWS